MKKLLILCSLFIALQCNAQTSIVTATIHDPSGQLYINGTCTVQFQETPGTPGPYTVSGTAFNKQPSCTINGSGVLTVTVTRNDLIQPGGSSWSFIVTPNASSSSTSLTTQITTSPQDISTVINNAITTNIAVSAQNKPFAYSDSEIITPPQPGNNYFNVTDNSWHFWTGSLWASTILNLGSPIFTNVTVNGTLGVTGVSTLGVVNATTFTDSGDSNLTTQQGSSIIYVDKEGSWAAALAACPTNGCVLDGRSQNTPLNMGMFDPGTKVVTIYLGPYTYTADHFVLRSNFHFFGMGGISNTTGTQVVSVGLNTQPLIVIPQVNSTPAQHVEIRGIHFAGLAGNTSQDGLFADCSGFTNSGLWYSDFKDLSFTGFNGVPLHLKGRPSDALSVNQFLTFKNIFAQRTVSTSTALKIEGANGQISFEQSEFDGTGTTLTNSNIYIGTSGATTQSPYSIMFHLLTTQGSDTAVILDGVGNITFDGTHVETTNGVFLINTTGQASQGIVIENSTIATSAVNAGNGFFVKSNGPSEFGIVIHDNVLSQVPDHFFQGPNLTDVKFSNNFVLSATTLSSSGATTQLTPAATLTINGNHTIGLNTSGTSIQTINSSMLPGEQVTFIALGQVQFATGGNIDLTGMCNPLVLASGETATFVINDLTGTWRIQSTSTLTRCTLIANRVTINTGVTQGSGHKHQRFGATCTTGPTVGSTCTTIETWTPTAFVDTNYTPVCIGMGTVNAPTFAISSFTASTVTIVITAITAAAAGYSGVDCMADHD